MDQQKTCDSCGEQGMNGDLVIVYDVKRDSALGDIKVEQHDPEHCYMLYVLKPIIYSIYAFK